jgi:ethanolamine kinase
MPPIEFINARKSKQVALVESRPYYPELFVTKSNEDDPSSNLAHSHSSLISTALSIIFHDSSTPSQLAEKLEVKAVTGGITNALYVISGFSPIQPYDSVLIRVFGAEGMIDRDVETSSFASLAEQKIAPQYFGRFGNGRLEGWLKNHSALMLMDLQTKSNAEAIAKQMAHLHYGYKIPEYLREWHDEAKPGLWTQLNDWMSQAKAIDPKHGYKSKGDEDRAERLIDLSKMEKELAWLAESIISPDSKVAFCHNDLLSANIMKDRETGEIKFIDFEYGGVNFIGFDIANHFNEHAGGPEKKSGEPDYSMYPSDARQNLFISTYVKTSRGLAKGSSNGDLMTTEEEDIENLSKEVNGFVLINHIYWGLWAVNQAAIEGTEDFDYLAYAWHRFVRYFENKEEFAF